MTVLPRLMVAGLSGSGGKSLVAVGLARALRDEGWRVAGFKKGPDFIDAAWLGVAAGRPGRNLDTFMMPAKAVLQSLARAAATSDVAIIEGNRGVFDGVDATGTHSSAELAKKTGAPVVLVLDATKATRTVAVGAVGCRAMDPELNLAGVIVNRVASSRQERLVRRALEDIARVPVLGVIPRLDQDPLPERHLGLVTPGEHAGAEAVVQRLAEIVSRSVDVPALVRIAREASDLPDASEPRPRSPVVARVGVMRDRAFSFYYPENLAAIEEAGGEVIPFSPLDDDRLPDVDVLYGGGGFPELYAEALSANEPMRRSIARRIHQGLPVWAECGALMYLSEAIVEGGRAHPMVGVIPATVERLQRPQGHGYVRARVDRDNPFLPPGTRVAGHEFHYSKLREGAGEVATVMSLERGVGVGGRRDGLLVGQVVACYTHLHALGATAWAPGLVAAAQGGIATKRSEIWT
jgi:cobyrinic acid a,c-diamide synthase